jgi:hypothetical protein
MRYYNIVITDNAGAVVRQYTSLNADGSNNPQALRVTLDVPEFNFNTPAGLAMVRIYGVSFHDIASTKDINGKTVTVSAGMAKGLPLANPSQSGVITQGYIYQAFGNWQGTEITLDLIIAPAVGNQTQAAALTLNWKSGSALTGAVSAALTAAYPGFSVVGQYSGAVTANQDTPHLSSSMGDFAQKVFEFSKARNTTPNYYGANIMLRGNTFYLYDGTSADGQVTVPINFTDLVGNATWLEYGVMQFKSVMRADLSSGCIVTMPAGSNVLNVTNSFSQFRNNVSFSASYMVQKIRHLGDSRQVLADSWVTIVDCNLLSTPNLAEVVTQ